jgi:hypothetical protein
VLPYWPCNQSYFSIFDGNAAAIGLVENEQLRASLVRTFMLAKRLVDQYQRYNRVHESATLLAEDQNVSSSTTYALHTGAFAVVEAYQTLKPNVEQLRDLLDAELGLPRIPLPFIDSGSAMQDVPEAREVPLPKGVTWTSENALASALGGLLISFLNSRENEFHGKPLIEQELALTPTLILPTLSSNIPTGRARSLATATEREAK